VRIGILTQYYPPEIGAPQARLSELAARLKEHGHEVIVLSAMPNYPRGRVYAGYGGLSSREDQDGVDVVRSWIWPTLSTAVLPRTASYFSFVLSSLLVGTRRLPRLDVLITESPPLLLGLTGFALSRLKRARWVFNVSDLWPESAVVLGVLGSDSLSTRLAYSLEAFCYRRAWGVSCQSNEIRASIARRFPRVRTLSFFNGVDTQRFGPAPGSSDLREELGSGSAPLALYAGLFGIAQGLDQLLDAAERLKGEDLRIVLIGDGPEKTALVERAQRDGIDNVTFLSPRARDEMPDLLASADIAVVPLKGQIPGAVPSKLYEAMASGLPVVLVASGEPADIVRSAGAGIVVEPGDPESLAGALRHLARSPEERRQLGDAGRRTAVARFDRKRLCDDFIARLEE
jgi:glycosyltransferase involved in cell wall biosynthesis